MVVTQPIDTDLISGNVRKDVRILDTIGQLQALSIGEVVSSTRPIAVWDKFGQGQVFGSGAVKFTPYPGDATKILVWTLDMLTVTTGTPTNGTACSVGILSIDTGVFEQKHWLNGRRSPTTVEHFADSVAKYITSGDEVTLYWGADENGYFSIFTYNVVTDVMTSTNSSQSSAPGSVASNTYALGSRTVQFSTAYVSTAGYYATNTNTAYGGMFTTIKAI